MNSRNKIYLTNFYFYVTLFKDSENDDISDNAMASYFERVLSLDAKCNSRVNNTGRRERTVQLGDPKPFPPFINSNSTIIMCDVYDNDEISHNQTVLQTACGKQYLIARTLSSAIYGKVVLGSILERVSDSIIQLTDKRVAIKVIQKEKIDQFEGRYSENPLTELAAVQFVGNENRNIIGQIDCCSDAKNIYLVMKYCSQGSLSDFMHYLDEPMDDDMARDFMNQMLNGLEELHSLGIAHRDFSSRNILVDEVNHSDHLPPSGSVRPEYRYLISDFGMALRCPPRDDLKDDRHMDALSFKHIRRSHYKTGKRKYMAPEIFTGSSAAFPDMEYVNPMLCDIWALGITLFYVLTGACYPMEAATVAYPNYNAIACNRFQDLVNHFRITLNSDAVDLLQKILQVDPTKRLTIRQIREHPWMNR